MAANTTLVALELSYDYEYSWDRGSEVPIGLETKCALLRNAQLPFLWWILGHVAQKSPLPKLRSLVDAMSEDGFRRRIFPYFLPGTVDMPRGFLSVCTSD